MALLGQQLWYAAPCAQQRPKLMYHSTVATAFRERREFSSSNSGNRNPGYGGSSDSAREDAGSDYGSSSNNSNNGNNSGNNSSSGWQRKDVLDNRRSNSQRSSYRERDDSYGGGGGGGGGQGRDRWQERGRRDDRNTAQGRTSRGRGSSGWQPNSRDNGHTEGPFSRDRRRDEGHTADDDDAEGGDWREEGDGEGGEDGEGGWGRGQRQGAGHQDVRRSELQGEALYGVFPILNALNGKRRSAFHTLYVLSTLDMSARKDAASVQAVLSAAKAMDVPVQRVSRHELNLLSNDRPHQGLVLDCAPLANQPLDVMPVAASVRQPGAAPPVWLALDEVMDPQNLGAILRSAWCLGAAGMLVSAKNCAPLSPAVSKASAGALELAPVHSCKNMQRTLQDAASRGWAVLGAAGESGAVDSATLPVTQPTILVMGNEGYGLRTNVRRACTGLVKVHMQQGFTAQIANATAAASALAAAAAAAAPAAAAGGSAARRIQAQGGVDSLNVSVATGILLHDLLTAARRSTTPAVATSVAKAT